MAKGHIAPFPPAGATPEGRNADMILAGDFNVAPGSPLWNPAKNARTPAGIKKFVVEAWPRATTTGGTPAGGAARPISDHAPIWASFKTKNDRD